MGAAGGGGERGEALIHLFRQKLGDLGPVSPEPGPKKGRCLRVWASIPEYGR